MIPQFHSQWAARSSVLDTLPRIATEAAHAIHARTRGTDPGLIRTQMLAFMAAAAAPLYRISMPGWTPIPLDFKAICVGRSGSGKSPVFRILIKPFQAFAEERTASFARECEEHAKSEAVRRVMYETLASELKKKRRVGEDTQDVASELKAHAVPSPPPRERCRLANFIHFEKLVALLDGSNEAVDLLLEEGDEFLSGLLLRRHAGTFNELYDGTGHLEGPQQRRKATRGTSASVSMLCLVRESALARYLPTEMDGKLVKSPLVDNGFFARGLVYFADNLPSWTNFYVPNDPDEAIRAFNQAMLEMLELHHAKLVAGDFTPSELQLAPDAVGFWNQIGDDLHFQRGGLGSPIDEFLGKMESLTAKIAATLHVYESASPFISFSALRRAWTIVTSHLGHYERAFAPPPPPSTTERDVRALAGLLRDLFYKDPESRTISATDCSIRLDISNRRALRAAYRLAEWGLVAVESGDTIYFEKIMSSTPFITRRF